MAYIYMRYNRTCLVFLRDPHKNRQSSPVFCIFCAFEEGASLQKGYESQPCAVLNPEQSGKQ